MSDRPDPVRRDWALLSIATILVVEVIGGAVIFGGVRQSVTELRRVTADIVTRSEYETYQALQRARDDRQDERTARNGDRIDLISGG